MMQTQMGVSSPSTSDGDYYPGMSDEEEMRRMGAAYANGQGTGDIFAEIDADALEMGLRSEQ